MTYKIIIPYWESSVLEETQTRLNNLRFVEENLSRLVKYIRDRGLDIKFEIFDFSKNPTDLVKVTHIPYGEKGEFRKSEKMNICIAHTDEDIFIGWDADIVVRESDFENLYQVLSNFNVDRYYNSFNVKAVKTTQDKIDYINFTTDNLEDLPGSMYHEFTLSLGGLFIIPTQYLKLDGGYDENLTHRGGEDGDLHDRLYRKYEIHRKPILNFYGYHLPHDYNFRNPLYQQFTA